MELTHLWSTPFYQGTFDPTELLTWALANQNISDPQEADNTYPYGNALFDLSDEAVQNFKQLALGHFSEFLQEGFNLSYDDFSDVHITAGGLFPARVNYEQPSHNHVNTHLSGVYYLMSNERQCILSDPRFSANRGYPAIFKDHFYHKKITPEAGTFILFPSYVWHSVQHSNLPRFRVITEIILTE